jgi:23S rRNA (uracil1939-C5)-methyltransferase
MAGLIETLRIERLAAGGDGLARGGEGVVFVPFALPGELCRVEILEGRKDWRQGRLLELLEPSPHRVEAPCPLYGECGGCNLQHLAYPRQLEEKVALVREGFRRLGKLELDEISSVPSLPFAYRSRLQLHFTQDHRLGFMRRSSSEVISAPSCPVAVLPVQSWIEERADSLRAWEELRNYVAGKDRFLVYGLGSEVKVEGRDGVVEASLLGKRIAFHVKGFFQSNLYLLELLVGDLLEGLEEVGGGVAADLYGGVGLFGAFLRERFGKLVEVEQDPFALDLARRNAPGKDNEYHALSVDDWTKTGSARQEFDLVLVDPPRTGLSPGLRSWLVAKRPPLLAYVSCDHVTLARDAAALAAGGFRLDYLKVFDFYPQTGHVECHARFRPV